MKNSLLLNKGIYSRDAIQMSISAFGSLADISVVEEDNCVLKNVGQNR